MKHRFVALLRGVNVGRAKRVAMADLRSCFQGLGYEEVATVLNSGNVLFSSRRGLPSSVAGRIEAAIESELGVSSRVLLLSAAELGRIVADNPLPELQQDPARLLVAIPFSRAALSRLAPLTERDWAPDALGLGRRAAYLSCPGGILKSPLSEAVSRALAQELTGRNWATIGRLRAALGVQGRAR